MNTYTAFNLIINSDFELPSLRLADSSSPNITIKKGHVSKSGLDSPTTTRAFSQMSKNKLWLHVPDVAWFYVTNGNSVVVEPEIGSDEQTIRLYLLGSCMGALMHQRNRLVIHGNAIRFGDECVIFAGNSGNGKSTLAAALHKRGYQVLSDDLAVIDDEGKVLPSYPQMKLWHDTATKLDIDISQLKRIRHQVNKYAYPIKEGFCETPLPVRAIYILHSHNQDDFQLKPIHGIAKFNPLKNNTYRAQYLKGLDLKPEHLKLCSQIGSQAHMSIITRPNAGFKIGKLIDLIENDLKAEGTPSE